VSASRSFIAQTTFCINAIRNHENFTALRVLLLRCKTVSLFSRSQFVFAIVGALAARSTPKPSLKPSQLKTTSSTVHPPQLQNSVLTRRRTCEVSRKRKLRELYGYTSYISRRTPKDPQAICGHPSSPNEAHFLDENDIAKYALSFVLVLLLELTLACVTV